MDKSTAMANSTSLAIPESPFPQVGAALAQTHQALSGVAKLDGPLAQAGIVPNLISVPEGTAHLPYPNTAMPTAPMDAMSGYARNLSFFAVSSLIPERSL
jgi:hypothetical protein